MLGLRYLVLGSSFARRPTSLSFTRLLPPERKWRLRLESRWPRLCRRVAEYRLKPFAVLRKRFEAARLVFNLGTILNSSLLPELTRRPLSPADARLLADHVRGLIGQRATRSLLFRCE